MSDLNRRELLKGLATIAGGAGVAIGSVEDVPAEPLPLLMVLRTYDRISDEARKCIQQSWAKVREGNDKIPQLVVLDNGATLDAVIDPRVGDRRYVSGANGNKGRVFDANGVEIERCMDADLATGRCTVWEADETGQRTFKTVSYRPAPLRFEPLRA